MFKCCKNKDFNNYCCKACLSVYHDACLARRKNVSVIEGHIILCSKECSDGYRAVEDEVVILQRNLEKLRRESGDRESEVVKLVQKYDTDMEELRVRVSDLLKEIDERDTYLEKLRRSRQDFEDQVLEQEQSMNLQIDKQRKLIGIVSREKDEISRLCEDLRLRLEESLARIRDLESQLREFNGVREEMIETIRVLTADNDVYSSEILRLKNSLSSGSRDDVCPQSNQDVMMSGKQRSESKKGARRILILCDEYGRHLDRSLKLKDESVLVETIIKPGALFRDVIEDIVALTKNYTLNDCVVIVAGSNDLRGGKSVSFRDISDRVRYCTNTNIIFTSVPGTCCPRYLKKSIDQFNDRLFNYANRLDSFAEGIVGWVGLHMRSRRVVKDVVAAEILMKIGASRSHTKNLIFVTASCDASDFDSESVDSGRVDFLDSPFVGEPVRLVM